MAETFSVPIRGVGKPDYERIVAGAKERRGIHLDYGQTLKVASLVFTTEVQVVVLAALGYVNCVLADIGKMVVDDGGNTAVLSAYDNASRQWQIGWPTPVAAGSVMTITGGVGSGIALASVLNPFPWVIPPLAPGAVAHVIDVDTGLPTPFNVPQGYTLTLIAVGSGITEDAIAWGYMDGPLAIGLGVFPGGQSYFENKLTGLSTAQIDSTGATAHTMDVTITNLGLGNMLGTIDYILILEKVGSPPLPSVKMVKCKWCGHEFEVPNETTSVTCPKCGRLSIVYDLSKVKRTP